MEFHNFDLVEPIPELNEPHALAIVRPWLDSSNVGSLVLSELENVLKTKVLGKLIQPGEFFDFTRYRPALARHEDRTLITLPTSVVHYGRLPEGRDLLLINLLEPHNKAEIYVESVAELLNYFGVRRYALIGSVYDLIPYTRPLYVTGNSSNLSLRNELAVNAVVPNDYQGPTSVLSFVGEKALQSGIETCSMVVHLPNYLTMDNDYRGKKRLMEIISNLYNVPVSPEDIVRAGEQEERVRQLAEQFLEQEPRGRIILQQLEASYDARVKNEKGTHLSPEVEKFLQDVSKRFRQD